MKLRPRRRGRGHPQGGHMAQVRLLHDGEQALPAMLEAIAAAEHEVLLEMYWFGSDRTGRSFADALAQKARAGVSVRVIYDAVGSLETDGAMFEELTRAGVEVFEYNPIAPWRERFAWSRIGRRNHRKLLVIDACYAFVGGINLGDPWAARGSGGAGFRDDAVGLSGAPVAQMRTLFYRTLGREPPPLPQSSFSALGRHHEAEVLVLATQLRRDRRDIYDAYVNAIARASREILIANSYFIPPTVVRRALSRAVERGVRVRVLVPQETDVLAVRFASHALYESLLAAGIEIFEWRGGVLHSKTAVIDDDWCTVGSFNFDALSIRNNLELNVAMRSPAVAAALRARIEADLSEADRIDLSTFRARHPLFKLLERAFYSLRWGL